VPCQVLSWKGNTRLGNVRDLGFLPLSGLVSLSEISVVFAPGPCSAGIVCKELLLLGARLGRQPGEVAAGLAPQAAALLCRVCAAGSSVLLEGGIQGSLQSPDFFRERT